MTLQRQGDTQYFTPPNEGRFPDVWQIARPPQITPVQGTLKGARYSVTAVDQNKFPGLYHWMLQIYDLRGTMKQVGRYDESYANWSSSTGLDCRYEQVACLPFLTTADSSPAAPANIAMTIHSSWVPAFNQLAIAFYDLGLAHSYLYTETSPTNPALVQITFDRGTPITYLGNISCNGTDYLGVASIGENIQLLSNLTVGGPTRTSLGAGTSTAACTSFLQFPLPHSPLIMHIGNAFYVGPTDVAPAAFMPTLGDTGVPVGGYALGPASFAGSPIRAWFVVGDGNPSSILPGNATGSAIDTSIFRGRLASVNGQAFDYQETYLPLKSVQIGTLVRDGGVFSDTDRVIFYNGRVMRDLTVFADPPVNSDYQYKICGFWVRRRDDLFALINEVATAAGVNVTRRAKWRYDWDLNVWQQVSPWVTLTATSGIQSFFGTGSNTGTLPISELTGYFHEHATQATTGNTWFRQFQSLPGVNPWSFRKTTGATATTGQAVEATASWTSPVWDIPGLEGWPKIVTRIQGPPTENIGAGGSDAYVTVDVNDGAASRKFTAREPTGRYPVSDAGYRHSGGIQTIQATITAVRTTTGTDPTHLNLNVLPITIEGFCAKERLEVPTRWFAGQRQ